MGRDRRRKVLLGLGLAAVLVGTALLVAAAVTAGPGYAVAAVVLTFVGIALAVGATWRSSADRAAAHVGGGNRAVDLSDEAAVPPPRPVRRGPAPVDDPGRDRELGEILVALRRGPTPRDELARRLRADGWDPDRFAAAVDHGLSAGVLREDGGALRARYDD